MGLKPFEADLVHLDGYVRVTLRGELDFPAVRSDEAAKLAELSEIRRHRVVFDLSGLTFMDSAGIGLLLNIQSRHDGPIRLEGAQPVVRRIVEMNGLGEVFDLG